MPLGFTSPFLGAVSQCPRAGARPSRRQTPRSTSYHRHPLPLQIPEGLLQFSQTVVIVAGVHVYWLDAMIGIKLGGRRR